MPIFALVIGHLWALPITALGYLQALVGGARFVGFTRLGVAMFASGRRGAIGLFFGLLPVSAYTWGAVVVFARPDLATHERLLRHELEHTRQAFCWGPLFPLAYVLASLIAGIRTGRWYADNAFERQARAAERIPL